VRADLVVLQEGDRVPADIKLLEARDLQTDESLLTGESVPVRKTAASSQLASVAYRPGGDDVPYAYSGSLVVRGTGLGEVIAIGPRSEIGKIGQSIGGLETEPSRLQEQTRGLVRNFCIAGIGVSALAVLLYGLLRGGWLDALLAGLALGMSMLPEEFSVVLTVFMAMGAWRISRARVLTRRASAIEALGSATILCTDKTGTLTENRMIVAEARIPTGTVWRRSAPAADIPDDFIPLIETAVLASARDPFDPMEKAFHELGQQIGPQHRSHSNWELVRAYGLSPDLLAMTHVWRPQEGDAGFVIAAKGAPEAVAQLARLSPAASDRLKENVDTMGAEGLRVLAVAGARLAGGSLPDSQGEFEFAFLGLVGLADPLRRNVAEAVAACRSAGIRVVMITGDYPATARSIAREAGIDAQSVLSGAELGRLNDPELRRALRSVSVFARIMPEHKLRLVNAFKSNGEVVAMIGDGVNDAPSLKAANIGVAMGGRGTDVAREASSIVLLDDNFGSIVRAIRLGRRIYDNLRKAMCFILAVHVPIAGLALLPLAFGLPVIFGPVHIAFLEMIIDPICALAFEAEAEEDAIMQRPPRPPDEPLFSRASIIWSVVQGAFTFGLVAAIFLVAYARGMPEDELRALTFFSLVFAIIGLVLVNRSFSASLLAAFKRRNPVFWWILCGIGMILTLSLTWPVAGRVLRFGPLHADDLALTLAAGAGVLLALEWLKPLLARRLVS
jgi:Ca2+-transporting ATPase